MKDKQFYFELRDNTREFIRAFNNIVISRYNKERIEQKRIPVRIFYAPKKAVVMSLNKGKNITIPAISVVCTNYALDTQRIFNKAGGFRTNSTADSVEKIMRQPVPINMSINMQILAKNQIDMDQILSNFVPNTTQYFVISLGLPPEVQATIPQELRCIVKWDGNVSLDYSATPTEQDDHFLTASTNFTLETWLFPKVVLEKPIYHAFLNYRAETVANPILEQQQTEGNPDTGNIEEFVNLDSDIVQPPYNT